MAANSGMEALSGLNPFSEITAARWVRIYLHLNDQKLRAEKVALNRLKIQQDYELAQAEFQFKLANANRPSKLPRWAEQRANGLKPNGITEPVVDEASDTLISEANRVANNSQQPDHVEVPPQTQPSIQAPFAPTILPKTAEVTAVQPAPIKTVAKHAGGNLRTLVHVETAPKIGEVFFANEQPMATGIHGQSLPRTTAQQITPVRKAANAR
jgi:hypothetical protein